MTRPARYDVDGKLVNPDAHRIVDLAFDGAPIDPAAALRRGDQQLPRRRRRQLPRRRRLDGDPAAPDTNRDVIVRFIVEAGEIAPASDGNWHLAPAGGATVLFDTGPGSTAYLDDVRARGLAIEPAGDAPDGFLRYRITL